MRQGSQSSVVQEKGHCEASHFLRDQALNLLAELLEDNEQRLLLLVGCS